MIVKMALINAVSVVVIVGVGSIVMFMITLITVTKIHIMVPRTG